MSCWSNGSAERLHLLRTVHACYASDSAIVRLFLSLAPLPRASCDRPLPFPSATRNKQVIAEHFFHEGLFDIGQAFVEEAGVEGGDALRRPYASMHTVLSEVRRRVFAACQLCRTSMQALHARRAVLCRAVLCCAVLCWSRSKRGKQRRRGGYQSTAVLPRLPSHSCGCSGTTWPLRWTGRIASLSRMLHCLASHIHSSEAFLCRLHTLQIQRHNLAPALDWVREHQAALAGPGGAPSAFEFSIHRLAFLSLLREQGGWQGGAVRMRLGSGCA